MLVQYRKPSRRSSSARGGTIRDPFGHRWFVQTQIDIDDVPVEDAPGRRFGDIGYLTLRVPDAARAAQFYGALFGWTLHGGPEGFHIASITPPAGIQDRVEEPEVRVFFRVDDIETVAQRVRDATGKADAGTIRKEFGQSIERNAVHGSANPADAAREVTFFFPATDLL